MKSRLPIEEIYQLYKSGKHINEIATIYHCSNSTIYNKLHQYCKNNSLSFKATNREIRENREAQEYEDYNRQIYIMHQSGITIQEIANTMGTNYNVIYRKLNKYCRKNKIPFNAKIRESKSILSNEKIYQMFQKGIPTKQIAKVAKCSLKVIYVNLHHYCNEHGIPFNRQNKKSSKNDLLTSEMYKAYNDGATISELAKSYNRHNSTICNRLHHYCKENNITWKNHSRKKKLKIPTSQIYTMYQNGISVKKIAELAGCSLKTIHRRLHQYCDEQGINFTRQDYNKSKTSENQHQNILYPSNEQSVVYHGDYDLEYNTKRKELLSQLKELLQMSKNMNLENNDTVEKLVKCKTRK